MGGLPCITTVNSVASFFGFLLFSLRYTIHSQRNPRLVNGMEPRRGV